MSLAERRRSRRESSRRQPSAAVRVRVFVGLLLAMAIGSVVAHVTPPTAHLAGHDGWLTCLLLAIGFGLVEVYPVHVHFMRNSHSYSMFEVPLTIGLFLAAPREVVIAHLLGAGAALVFHRHQRTIKLAFNLAAFVIVDQVAIAIFRALAHGRSGFVPRSVGAASVAIVAASCLSALAVATVIALAEGRRADGLASSVGFATASSLVGTSLGLIGVAMMAAYPWAAWLLFVPTVALYFATRTFANDRRRTEGIEFLHESSALLHTSTALESALVHLVQHARATFRAGYAELAYQPEVDGDVVFVSADDTGANSSGRSSASALVAGMIECAIAANGPLSLVRSRCTGDEAAFLDHRRLSDAIIAPLRGEDAMRGVAVIGNRLGDVARFDRSDGVLLTTFAANVTVALDNNRLEQTLDDLRLLQHRLTFQATHDPLTGLANRALFVSEVAGALAASEQSGAPACVLFLDLDDFKAINDRLGHGVGDTVLLATAQRLQATIPDNSLAARLGGDEFAVLLPSPPSGDDVVALAERLVGDRLSDGGGSAATGVSIGIAFSRPGISVPELMHDADMAMYEAKSRGKNCVAVFQKEHDARN
jgi:diguanylate cyclase (GGDEF)-like protein